MGKKATKQTITIECDSPEVYTALTAFFNSVSGEVSQQLKGILNQMQVESDPSFTVQPNGDIKASRRTYDKGYVIVTKGGKTIDLVQYKELPKDTVYAYPNQGVYSVYQKSNGGVDGLLGHIQKWSDLPGTLSTVKPKEVEQAEAPKMAVTA
jgi:hypothetical protein